VLACTTPGGAGSHPMPARTVRLFMESGGLEPAVALRRFVENALADDTLRTRPELVDRILVRRLSSPFDEEGWRSQAAAGMSFDALDRLERIAAPTLVLHGTEDAVVDLRNSELLASR